MTQCMSPGHMLDGLNSLLHRCWLSHDHYCYNHNNWESETNSPSPEDRRMKMRYIHTMKRHAPVKKNEITELAGRWMGWGNPEKTNAACSFSSEAPTSKSSQPGVTEEAIKVKNGPLLVEGGSREGNSKVLVVWWVKWERCGCSNMGVRPIREKEEVT